VNNGFRELGFSIVVEVGRAEGDWDAEFMVQKTDLLT
jgi:hypothetical protein